MFLIHDLVRGRAKTFSLKTRSQAGTGVGVASIWRRGKDDGAWGQDEVPL